MSIFKTDLFGSLFVVGIMVISMILIVIVLGLIIPPEKAVSQEFVMTDSQTYHDSIRELGALGGLTDGHFRRREFSKSFIQAKGWIAAGLTCHCCIPKESK